MTIGSIVDFQDGPPRVNCGPGHGEACWRGCFTGWLLDWRPQVNGEPGCGELGYDAGDTCYADTRLMPSRRLTHFHRRELGKASVRLYQGLGKGLSDTLLA